MNVPLLRRIQRQIDKVPERFFMEGYTDHRDCGTAYCIAGWAHVLTGREIDPEENSGEVAAAILGLSPDQGWMLFSVDEWPAEFQSPDDAPELPANAIARIDHFIATEGRE